jgi:hypothetical protein
MQDLSRRQFIASSAFAANMPLAFVARMSACETPGEMSFIHLFVPGGWPCNDLWDPKPKSPFRKGMRGSELTSTTWPIETSVPGMMVSQHLSWTGQHMHKGLIVRSLTDPDNTLDHAQAQRRMVEALTFDMPTREMSVVPCFRGDPPVYQEPDRGRDEYMAMWSAVMALLNEPLNGAARITDRFLPYQGFDAHESGGHKLRERISRLDAMISGLVEMHIHLDNTILCISSEFNRTIAGRPAPGSDLNTGENLIINDERDYGFHAHFAEANSIVLFGGPFKRGFVYGETGPRHPMRVVENPVTLADIHATIAVALGVQPREGRVIEDLFA